MKEITGELWDYYGKPEFVVCITTNGTVKANGECAMGRGCAMEAKQRFPTLPKALGSTIREFGNHAWRFPAQTDLMSFPVKHQWFQQADLELIKRSAEELAYAAACGPGVTFVLPRPGCGNGRLTWAQVKPVIEGILPDNVWVISREGL